MLEPFVDNGDYKDRRLNSLFGCIRNYGFGYVPNGQTLVNPYADFLTEDPPLETDIFEYLDNSNNTFLRSYHQALFDTANHIIKA
jgi:hypothetical protein